MKFAVLGCGSIGKRHLGNLLALGERELLGIDLDAERRAGVAAEMGVPTVSTMEEGINWGAEAFLVCTPTALHFEHALAAARAGCHLFVEKPVAHHLTGRPELLEVLRTRKLRSLVGCNLRFHPGLMAARELLREQAIGKVVSARAQFGQYLPDWHPWEDYRRGYSAQRALGGGVILDRVHEIDYTRWLLGEPDSVFCMAGHYSGLEIETEDVAELVLRVDGIPVSIHLDYVRRQYDCRLDVTGEEGTLEWWFLPAELRLRRPGYRDVHRRWRRYNINDTYVEELGHFLRVLRGEEASQQDIEAGYRALAIALAALRSAESGKAEPVTVEGSTEHP